VQSNTATSGSGVGQVSLINCTVVQNSGEAVQSSALQNSIVISNGANGVNPNSLNTFAYCYTDPLAPGVGNITNAPQFADAAAGDFHLLTTSPCINAGNNSYVAGNRDLDNNPRIAGGTVDLGAYEFQSPGSILSYAWAQQNGLPTDGSADYADADGDGMNNWQEWRAGTNPTNALSLLQVFPPHTTNGSGITISWQSVNSRSYFLERSTNLFNVPAFLMIQSNIIGNIGTTSYTDTNATAASPYFYRVGVE
jgi:hypothetical protein